MNESQNATGIPISIFKLWDVIKVHDEDLIGIESASGRFTFRSYQPCDLKGKESAPCIRQEESEGGANEAFTKSNFTCILCGESFPSLAEQRAHFKSETHQATLCSILAKDKEYVKSIKHATDTDETRKSKFLSTDEALQKEENEKSTDKVKRFPEQPCEETDSDKKEPKEEEEEEGEEEENGDDDELETEEEKEEEKQGKEISGKLKDQTITIFTKTSSFFLYRSIVEAAIQSFDLLKKNAKHLTWEWVEANDEKLQRRAKKGKPEDIAKHVSMLYGDDGLIHNADEMQVSIKESPIVSGNLFQVTDATTISTNEFSFSQPFEAPIDLEWKTIIQSFKNCCRCWGIILLSGIYKSFLHLYPF